MIVKLIKNPWANTTKLPEGLTLNKEYKCIEQFEVNTSGDKYFRIINDFGEQGAWNKTLFIMIEGEGKEEHNKLIKELELIDKFFEEMTEEDFDYMIKRNRNEGGKEC